MVALAAAALAGSFSAPGVNTVRVVDAQTQAGGAGGMLNKLGALSPAAMPGLLSRGAFGSGWTRPTYRNRFPISVAQGKRNARKARNRLRSRGQHRKAVR
jgi:hypothetical protein